MLNATLHCEESPTKKKCYEEPSWIREILKHCNNDDKVMVKLVCGGDLLESFSVPGLWLDEDVSMRVIYQNICSIIYSIVFSFKQWCSLV